MGKRKEYECQESCQSIPRVLPPISACVFCNLSPDWNLPTPLIPTTLADVIYDFCVREHISIVLLYGPQGWKDPESLLPHCRKCERALNTPAKTGLQGIVKPAPYTAFVEFSIAVFAQLVQRGARLAAAPQVTVHESTKKKPLDPKRFLRNGVPWLYYR